MKDFAVSAICRCLLALVALAWLVERLAVWVAAIPVLLRIWLSKGAVAMSKLHTEEWKRREEEERFKRVTEKF